MPKPPSELPESQVTPEPALEKRTRRQFTPDYKLRIIAEADARPDAEQTQRETQAARAIKARARKIQRWLTDNDDKPGKGKRPRKSNITDNESAKMKTSKGVIQGYDGVACVDAKHQIIVHTVLKRSCQ